MVNLGELRRNKLLLEALIKVRGTEYGCCYFISTHRGDGTFVGRSEAARLNPRERAALEAHAIALKGDAFIIPTPPLLLERYFRWLEVGSNDAHHCKRDRDALAGAFKVLKKHLPSGWVIGFNPETRGWYPYEKGGFHTPYSQGQFRVPWGELWICKRKGDNKIFPLDSTALRHCGPQCFERVLKLVSQMTPTEYEEFKKLPSPCALSAVGRDPATAADLLRLTKEIKAEADKNAVQLNIGRWAMHSEDED